MRVSMSTQRAVMAASMMATVMDKPSIRGAIDRSLDDNEKAALMAARAILNLLARGKEKT